MQHLFSAPRVSLYPGLQTRVTRSVNAAGLVHGLLFVALPLIAIAPPALPTDGLQVVTVSQVPPSAIKTPPRRDPHQPFAERAAASPLPLAVRDEASGREFTIDLGKIRRGRNDLFPFVTWDLRFLEDRNGGTDSGGLNMPAPYRRSAAPDTRDLHLDEAALQALVDDAWSRRERWSNLTPLTELAGRYDPDRGDLPRVFRAYVTQNVPQPYRDWTTPDAVFWVTLALAADDAPLVTYVRDYLAQHPASRVTTELLFLLDVSAESNCDVLGRLLAAGTLDRPLAATRRSNPDAYELATSLAAAYRSWIERDGVNAGERCLAARAAILRRVVETSPDGYGVSDARFRLGELFWLSGARAEAIRWWRGMRPDDRGAYDIVARGILGAIADAGADEVSDARIAALLREQERRWRVAALDRLQDFGLSSSDF